MPRTFRWIVLIVIGVLPNALLSQPPARKPNLRLLRQPVVQKTAMLPMQPSGPLPQVFMKDLPATPPRVSYENGMLSIVAENSTLGDILRQVHERSGAAIDIPPNATERVVSRLGPGPARDVLAALLNGSAFNYVMIGSPADPSSLARLILTPKPAGGATETAYQPQPQPYLPQPIAAAPGMGPGGSVAQAVQSDDEGDTEEDAEDSADPDQDQTGANAENGGDNSQPNAGPKTPEQILEMLRQKQQPGAAPGQPQQPFPRFNQNLQQLQQPDNNE